MIWLWHYGRFPKDQIDHIDCNPKNNKIENLRDVNTAQNHWNIGKTKQNKSGVKGVSWSNKEKKYVAQIIANNKHHWIGQFDTLKEAANAYKKAANKLHGNYARF